MKLHTYGLLRDSFRLAQEMESVRTIWRLRFNVRPRKTGIGRNPHSVWP